MFPRTRMNPLFRQGVVTNGMVNAQSDQREETQLRCIHNSLIAHLALVDVHVGGKGSGRRRAFRLVHIQVGKYSGYFGDRNTSVVKA